MYGGIRTTMRPQYIPIRKMDKEEINLLVDLVYNGAMNEFEEFYGDSVSYQELEQESYIELKSMLVSELGRIKFRKAREMMPSHGLTCKLEMTKGQHSKFLSIYEEKLKDKENSPYFSFTYGFKITNLRADPDPHGTGCK